MKKEKIIHLADAAGSQDKGLGLMKWRSLVISRRAVSVSQWRCLSETGSKENEEREGEGVLLQRRAEK